MLANNPISILIKCIKGLINIGLRWLRNSLALNNLDDQLLGLVFLQNSTFVSVMLSECVINKGLD